MADINNNAEISRMLSGEKDAESEKVLIENDKITGEHVEAFNSGKPVEFSTTGLSEEALQDIEAMNDMKIDELLTEEGIQEPVNSVPEFDYENDDEENILVQAGVTELKKFTLPRPIKLAIFWGLTVCISFSLGFVFRLFIARGGFDNYTDNVAYSSLAAVAARIDAGYEFRAHDIYVSRSADVTECIIFGVIYTELNDFKSTHYRLIINNKNRSNATLYRPFNQAEYDSLKDSTDPELRLRADTMMNHHENFLRSVGEINAGHARWRRANTERVNLRLVTEG